MMLVYSVSASSQTLDFERSGSIEQKFQITLPEKQFKKLLNVKGVKLRFKDFQVSRNSKLLDVNYLNLRGNNSLRFRRKSFTVALNSPVINDQLSIKKLSLTNLVMDKNYWRNRVCFILLNRIGLFPLYNEFSEVSINGETQGIYLVQQKVDDYATNIANTPLLLRRTQSNDYKEYESLGIEGKNRYKELINLQELSREHSGKELYDSLESHFAMDQYFTLLAFHTLLLNGDYTDELYIYYDMNLQKFNVIPWDFDDVFARAPHEGWSNRNLALSNKFIFSSEPYFDTVIDKDDFLYHEFLMRFQDLLLLLDEPFIKSAFEQVYHELYPYFNVPAIIDQSQYDANGQTTISKLEKDLQLHYDFLLKRRSNLDKDIQQALAR